MIGIIQSYITCDGRFASVFKCHVIFLQHLNHKSRTNFPFFLLKSLQKMSNIIKGQSDHTNQSLFHHGLIKLIIRTVLQKENRSRDHFLFWSGFSIEQGDHVKKRLLNKHYGFVNKFKRDVIEYLVQDSL